MDSFDQKLIRDQVRARLFGTSGDPKTIGRYRVLSRIGAGGMGVVYAAHDPDLDRQVALKIMHPGVADPERVARMVREAHALARVSHPNVVMVHDSGEQDGRVYLAMELLEGRTLDRWVAETHPDWRAVVDASMQAGRGLSAAHAKGLVHRDFKPSNAMMTTSGHVKVLDFGLVRPDDVVREGVTGELLNKPLEVRLTQTSALLGTPAYMAPEQLKGEAVDARTDVYALCASLYELLYGAPPYAAARIEQLLKAVLSGAVTPPPRDRGVPRAIETAILRGLSTTPDARQPSMQTLLEQLASASAPPQRRIAIWLGGLVALGAMAAGSFGLVVWALGDEPEPHPIVAAAVDAGVAPDDLPKPPEPMIPNPVVRQDAATTPPAPPDAGHRIQRPQPPTEMVSTMREDPPEQQELDTGELQTGPFTRAIIRPCWNQYQDSHNVTEAAPVTINITVAASGSVTSLSANCLSPVAELLSCIETRGRSHRFPRSNRERSEQFGVLLRPR